MSSRDELCWILVIEQPPIGKPSGSFRCAVTSCTLAIQQTLVSHATDGSTFFPDEPSTISQALSRSAQISAIERVWVVLDDVTTYCLTDGRANFRRRLSRGVVTYITSSRSIVIFPPLYNVVKL